MADPKTTTTEPSGITKLEDRAMRVIAWVVSMVIVIIGAVLYLEHRHQSLVTTLAEMRADIRHLDTGLSTVSSNNSDDHDKIYKALEALNDNDRELAIQVMEIRYCCDRPVTKKGSVVPVTYKGIGGSGGGSPKTILPWNIAMKGPGISVEKAQ